MISNLINEHTNFGEYFKELENFLRKIILSSGNNIDAHNINLFLDGSSDKLTRQLIPLYIRRKYGIFFTGEQYKKDFSKLLDGIINDVSTILDPACGIGNLLLLASDHLPTMNSLTDTCMLWGSKLHGYDIYPEFVQTTKFRLILKAISRGVTLDSTRLTDLVDCFCNIELMNFLSTMRPISKNTHVLLNPPYNTTSEYYEPSWSTGNISLAALFIDKCIKLTEEGAQIIAILPDVLRSGSRYERWRDVVSNSSRIRSIITKNQFDNWTDIHVFILYLVAKNNFSSDQSVWLNYGKPKSTKLGDYFEVHVGPVVPHRDKEEGLNCLFATCKDIRPWTTVSNLHSKRKYSGTLYKPPFVVLRRTSRPGQRNRLSPAIINTKESVAVENHLLVITPKSKTLKSCKLLVSFLSQEYVTNWIDKRIRCRHLTVKSIMEIPVNRNELL